LVREGASEFVRRLKGLPGRELCLLGGGELAQSLMAAGLVDRVRLNIHPVLLGAGTPAFRDTGARVKLRLTEGRAIDGECVCLLIMRFCGESMRAVKAAISRIKQNKQRHRGKPVRLNS